MPLVLVGFLPFNLGWPEAIVLGVLAIVLFGRRLPQVGRSLGRGLVEFKKGLQGMQDEIEKAGTEDEPKDDTPREVEAKEASDDEDDGDDDPDAKSCD